MVWIIILAVLAALILLVFFVPYGVEASYEDGVFRLGIKAGPIYIGLFPKKPLTEKQKARKEKKQAKKEKDGQQEKAAKLTFSALIVQGIATSIDALSVGFTIADYPVIEALLSALIIGVVTLAICFVGLAFGKRIGNKFSSTATIIGGAILIFIGIEVFVRGIFGL